MGIEAIGLALFGIATFLGLFMALGVMVGKKLAKRKKEAIQKAMDKLSDPTLKELVKNKMKEADDWISSADGQSKMSWVISQVSSFIPSNIDDKLIKDFFDGVYRGYKEELNKP
jgi:hypothetical protein